MSESDIQVFSKMFEKYDHANQGTLQREALSDIARAYQRQGSVLAIQRKQSSIMTKPPWRVKRMAARKSLVTAGLECPPSTKKRSHTTYWMNRLRSQ